MNTKKIFMGAAVAAALMMVTSISYAEMTYNCYAKFGENHPLMSGALNQSANNADEAVQKAYKWYKDNYPDVTVVSISCK